jgi:peptide/nickel transport system substrate-binding protein
MVLLASMAFASCTREVPETGNALVIAVPAEPSSLDPLLLEGAIAAMVGTFIYSFLVTDGPNGDNVPDVATEVPTRANGGISSDGLRIVYHLRHDVRWQDGAPLTARDCVFTYDAIMNSNNAIPSRFGYEEIKSVRALGAYTLELTLARPSRDVVDNFLALDGNYPIMPAHLLARYSSINRIAYNERPIGSGPYRVTNWVHGDHISLAANPQYFRGAPHISDMRLEFVTDSTTMLDELRTGEVGAAFTVDPALLQEARSIPNVRIVLTPVSGMGLLIMNLAQDPTADLRVREAIARAIDTKLVVDKASRGAFLSGNARRVYLKLPPGGQSPPYDPARARALLDAAGWRVGPGGIRVRDGRRLVLPLVTSSIEPMSDAVTALVQGELRTVGIDAVVRNYAPALYLMPGDAGGPVFGGRYSIAYFAIVGEVNGDLRFFYACSEAPPQGFDVSRLCDPRVDAALLAGSEAETPRAVDRDNADVERLVEEDVPDVVLYQERYLSVFTTRLHGFDPLPVTPFNAEWRWIL